MSQNTLPFPQGRGNYHVSFFLGSSKLPASQQRSVGSQVKIQAILVGSSSWRKETISLDTTLGLKSDSGNHMRLILSSLPSCSIPSPWPFKSSLEQCVCVYVCARACVCATVCCVHKHARASGRSEKNEAGVCSPPHSGSQAWWQGPLPAEPSQWHL